MWSVADADVLSKTVKSNVQKLDYLVKSQARQDIRDIERELVEFKEKENKMSARDYRLGLAELEAELRDANNYYDCIRAEKLNCESER